MFAGGGGGACAVAVGWADGDVSALVQRRWRCVWECVQTRAIRYSHIRGAKIEQFAGFLFTRHDRVDACPLSKVFQHAAFEARVRGTVPAYSYLAGRLWLWLDAINAPVHEVHVFQVQREVLHVVLQYCTAAG